MNKEYEYGRDKILVEPANLVMNKEQDSLKLSIVIKPDSSSPVMKDEKMNEETLKSHLVSSPDGITKFKQTLKNG